MKRRPISTIAQLLLCLTIYPVCYSGQAAYAGGLGTFFKFRQTSEIASARTTNSSGKGEKNIIDTSVSDKQSNAGKTAEPRTSLQVQPSRPTQKAIIRSGNRPTVGLALGGGGTRGLAHITILRTLEKNGIPIDCISGTSMGAIVGGMYASGMSPDEIELVMRGKKFLRSYETVPIPVRLALVPVFFLPHYAGAAFGYHPYDGLYRGNKFAHYIDHALTFPHKNIEECRIPFCAVASNLLDGTAYSITTGDVGRACQASSAIPGLRRPLYWQDKLLVDGGVVANLPVKQCRDLGADIVIAVDVDERLDTIPDKHFCKLGSVLYRCLNMHLTTVDHPQVVAADVVIHPDVNGIELLSSKMKDMNAALDEGEKAALKAIPVIQEQIDKKLANRRSEDAS
jgi:NTE family protein